MTGVEPVMVPSQHASLLATPFGLLLNELHRAPTNVVHAACSLLEGEACTDTLVSRIQPAMIPISQVHCSFIHLLVYRFTDSLTH